MSSNVAVPLHPNPSENRFPVVQREFIASKWKSAFAASGLHDFQDFWNLAAEPVDEGNIGRGGQSGIFRARITGPDGVPVTIYIKRQHNYRTRTWRNPINGTPTAQREFDVMRRLHRSKIETPEPVYFAVAWDGGDFHAILITVGLEGYTSWGDLQDARRRGNSLPPRQRWAALRVMGALLSGIHQLGLRHTCFYPKHLFLKFDYALTPNVCVLDLEQAKPNYNGLVGTLKDIRGIMGRRGRWSRTEKLRFLLAYSGTTRPNRKVRSLYRRLSR